MSIQFVVNSPLRVVTYSVIGSVSASDAKNLLEAILEHPRFRTGYCFLGDRRRMDSAPTGEYVRAVASLVEKYSDRLAPCRWAVLVSNHVGYGMARMWSLLASDSGVNIHPFFELTEAVEWLGLPHGYRPEILCEIETSRC